MEVAEAPALARPSGFPYGAGDRVRVRKKTLQAVLEQCQRALVLLKDADLNPDSVEEAAADGEEEGEEGEGGRSSQDFSSDVDTETDALCDLLKSKVESPEFLEKLGSIHMSVSHSTSADESATWDMVSAKDLWEDKHICGDEESDQDGYVLVKQEDIMEGIACFMAAYLLSLEQTKELTPDQLQEGSDVELARFMHMLPALSKTFSVKKKGKLQKAWDGSKVFYNVVSWVATAIGMYQNPALCRAATMAFSTSFRVISKLL